MSARIVVTGSRNWTDEQTIRCWLERLPRGTRLAHGAARGADTIAARIAHELGFDVHDYPASWSNGRGAGHVRNAAMLAAEMPTRVFAFALIDSAGMTPGTADCVRRALLLGVPVTVCPVGSRP